jgi:hypothetical protein
MPLLPHGDVRLEVIHSVDRQADLSADAAELIPRVEVRAKHIKVDALEKGKKQLIALVVDIGLDGTWRLISGEFMRTRSTGWSDLLGIKGREEIVCLLFELLGAICATLELKLNARVQCYSELAENSSSAFHKRLNDGWRMQILQPLCDARCS